MNMLTRRDFLLALTAVPLVGFFASKVARAAGALPAGKTAVPETDPVAMAFGYKHDATKADSKKYPQLLKPETKSQRCDNCNFYTKENDDWGGCQLIKAGLVNSKGWCGSWVKKA